MSDGPDIVAIAALIGDHARADILTALMAGRALTASELAVVAGVTKPTASAHLAKLLDAQLIAMERQGRHHYFELADRDVADLLEQLTGVAFRSGAVRLRSSPRDPALRKARVCYDHLAGELGVLIFDDLLERGAIERSGEQIALTGSARRVFAELGIDLDVIAAGSRRTLVRGCLDWSARRDHLAGALGAAMLSRFLTLGWACRAKDSRIVVFSPIGERCLRDWCTPNGTTTRRAAGSVSNPSDMGRDSEATLQPDSCPPSARGIRHAKSA